MRIFRYWILSSFLFACPVAYSLSGTVVSTDHVTARLLSETAGIGPGQSVWVALELTIRDGWHTYWRNPGDSGQATTLAWTLPPGFSAGEIVWTTPHRFELSTLVNFGYAKHAVHLVQITAPKDLPAGNVIPVHARAGWLVCSDVCIPEDTELELKLPTTAGAAPGDAEVAALFAAARSDVPVPDSAATRAVIRDGNVTLLLGPAWGAALAQITSLGFFPYDDGNIDYNAPQVMSRTQAGLQLTMKAGDRPPKDGVVRGVLVATEQTAAAQFTVPIEVAAAAGPAAVPGRPTSPAAAAPPPPLVSLVLFAVLGGLILNLMPCVFPVLSIKAIGLVEQGKKHPAAVRAKGLVFAAGVVGSMLCLAAALLALRAGGEQIGWGFQLQSPLFVTLMIYLLLAVGLNLSGVFEVGGGLAGVGDGLTRGDGHRAAFFTGVLTTLVATPCTAPFMAAAVGAALTQSTVVGLGIFAALGVGLSLPYVVLSFAPWLQRSLPKPGAWMTTLKEIFAFPMYASAAWLLWVLARQTSEVGLAAALAGAILIGLAAWAYQKSKFSVRGVKAVALATAVAALLLALLLPLRFADVAVASDLHGGTSNGGWQPYDATRVAELNAAGKPLLVNFTASWCLTCLVNERNAFADAGVQETFRRKGVTLMKGDWTNRDPAITQALSAFGRAGVPLYVIYKGKPGTTEPMILPQLLTANMVHEALADLPDHDLK